MSRKSFLQGAIVLGVAGIIVKVLGAFFRIPLANMIGEVGMGYYQTAYPIYVFLLVISTAGIPTAISKIVAEKNAVGNRYGAHRVFKVSFILMFVIGIVTSSILFFGAKYIVQILKNPGAYYSMIAIAPALLFTPVMAAYRGYFQGLQDMKPTAVSQIVEQFIRVAVGYSLALMFISQGLTKAAAGASFGAAAGAIGGSVFLIWIYALRRKEINLEIQQSRIQLTESAGSILKRVFVIAIPITIGAAIMPIMNMIDVAIVMRRLQAVGFTAETANGLYGQLTGMAGPIINFPQVLSMGIAMSLVPVVSDAFERKDYQFLRYNVESGVRVSMLIGLPCAFGIMALSEQIMLLLYPLQKASAVSAASSLSILAFGVIFLSLVQTLTGILQGLGKPAIPVRNLFIGGLLKILITFVLTGIYSINIKGAAIGTLVAYITATALNLYSVKKYTGSKFNIQLTVIKPLISVIVMTGVVVLSYKALSGVTGSSAATGLAIIIGALIYGLVLVAIKGITYDDLEMLPKGNKIARLLIKLKLISK
ncbi:MAG: polysaccharide biosynthesis protein [Clostridiales bacterium]|nr:polysaccharide biosynthesis protein [Clostridiales bacterium]